LYPFQRSFRVYFFVVFCLTILDTFRLASNRVAVIELTLQNIVHEELTIRQLHFTWSPMSEARRVPPVQDHIITEWAACGMACALVPLVTNFRVLQVTQMGDSFDYWIGDEQQEFGLEISGTLTNELETRHRSKIRQLLSNKRRVAGFVSVTSFGNGRSIFSFHVQKGG
jgi:hypothetical protein